MRVAEHLHHPGCRDHLFLSFRCLLLKGLRLLATSAGCQAAPDPPTKPLHFMVDYLVSSCGLSRDEARRASKPLAHLKSPAKPEAVLHLLKQEGMDDADIRRLVLRVPEVLLTKAKETLEPKIRALQGAGLSGTEIAQLLSLHRKAVYQRDMQRRVEFWRNLVGTNQNILKVMKRNTCLLCRGMNSRLIPGVSLIRSLGIPENKMGAFLLKSPRLVHAQPARVKTLVEEVKSLGFSPGSPCFVVALSSVSNLSKSTLDSKCKLLRSFGWTQAELTSAIQENPMILRYSEKKIRVVMDFLLNKAGCEPSYVARYSRLLGYNMEKRLIPRCYVLQSLKKEGLPLGSKGLHSTMPITEDGFIQKYIVPYSEKLPQLREGYYAICAKKANANVQNF